MTSIVIDRKDGLSSSVAYKGPARLSSSVNVPTNGLRVVDGVQTASGDRVVLGNQTDPRDNGLYVVDTGNWRRAADFNKTGDVVQGTRVWIVDGDTGPAELEVTSPDPVRIGEDAIYFDLSAGSVNAAALAQAVRDAEAEADRSEAAADIAAGYANTAVMGGTGNQYGVVTGLSAMNIPAGVTSFYAPGYASIGDGGGWKVKEVTEDGSPLLVWQVKTNGGTRRWEITPGRKVGVPEMFGAVGDGVTDDHPAIQKAADYLWTKFGGGVIKLGPVEYLMDSSLRLDGKSNIGIQGVPGHKSVLKASASLDGSSNFNKNDIVFAVNYPSGPVINDRQAGIWTDSVVYDGSLQSADAVPNVAAGGYSLAGFECSRVDYVRVTNCKFIKCYGNGVVMSSGAQSTLYDTDGVTRNGVEHGVVENCEFIEVCQGPLPNYASASAPMGIPGSAIQIGAGFSARVVGNQAYRLGGTFLECFNNEGLYCAGNTIQGTPITVTGGNTGADAAVFQSPFGSIKADFGLINSHIVNNTFIDCGGIELLGNMGGNFFNANTPSSGPKNCTIADNKFIRPTGTRGLGSVAVQASGAGQVYTAEGIQTAALGYNTNQTMRIIITGGTTVAAFRRRGTFGSYSGVTLGPSQSFLLHAGDAFYLTYVGAPTSIGAVLTPNASKSAITIIGGTAAKETSEVTISIATPGVVTWTAHGRAVGDIIRFTTTVGGALPTGLAVGTSYYIVSVPTADTFTLSATPGGAAIDTTGTQSGVHTASRWITGSADRNIVRNNIIISPGAYGIQMTDVSLSVFEGNHIENPGLAGAFAGIWMGQSVDQTGTGSFGNAFRDNRFFDTRSPKFMTSNIIEVGSRTIDNRFDNSRLELSTGTPIVIANTPTVAGGSSIAGSYGPGSLSAALAAPSVPASNTELHNPFPYDCFVFVAGGTVTAINTGPPSATVATGMTSGMVFVRHGERIRLTYSVAPTWVWRPAQ